MTNADNVNELRISPPPPRRESPIQMFQGCYYLLVGLWIAIGLSTWQGPVDRIVDLRYEWFIRLVAAVTAAVGVGLIVVSRRREPLFAGTWVGIIVPIVLTILDVIGLATQQLPTTFLVDLILEVGFFVWWMIALYWRPLSVVQSSSPVEQMGRPV